MSVTAPLGFVASGCHAGIKRRKHDMAMLATEDRRPVPSAAVFTRNLFVAPPVELGRSMLEKTGGQLSAIVVNSGNANAGTGERGLADAAAMARATAEAIGAAPDNVLVSSTGIIGSYLPMDPILAAIPGLARSLSIDGGDSAALGILTTDHRPKQVIVQGDGFTVGGMAKGCGMIAPNMGTMLAYLTTDAQADSASLQRMLAAAADATFNTLNVDGATSTNDTAVLMASGRRGPCDTDALARAVLEACENLTFQMAEDAEGMTKIVLLTVSGAASEAEARVAARAIAENNLVKCSWYGSDPYWGRILAAAGSCGVAFDTQRSSVGYGGILVAKGGVAIDHDATALVEHMLQQRISIQVDLGSGGSSARTIGIDLGPGYIKENSKTS